MIFIHPDLGIGGAERLVVDAAVSLRNKGHSVKILTSHHDEKHAFEETKKSSKQPLEVIVRGDWMPRHVLGRFLFIFSFVYFVFIAIAWCLCRFHVLFAILRNLWCALWLVLFGWREGYDIVFVDQISACIPVLRLRNARVPSLS